MYLSKVQGQSIRKSTLKHVYYQQYTATTTKPLASFVRAATRLEFAPIQHYTTTGRPARSAIFSWKRASRVIDHVGLLPFKVTILV